ncbi:MAG: BMP family ABC transporter substrate-binding protein [Clostridia bacterium]|nr:BMP family ABC transporter substrate-binding protein [Clostridia bacterium]
MKKIFALLLVLCMATALLVGCGGGDTDGGKLKIGAILIGDENEGYTFAHIKGIKDAVKALGEDKIEVIWKYTVGEDEKAYNAAIDLVEQGCTYIFSNSYGHQSHMLKAAQENPEVNFVAVTGDTAKTANLDNFSNAFNDTYESRYVSGVVAGMKIKELVEGNKLTDKNYRDGKVKIGYVGAFPYAEVVSGYTAFYLGIKSVYADVVMDVSYTNSWFSIPDEGAAAEAFIADGCVIISQHADSTGAPSAVQAKNKEGTVVYCVGYNIDMLAVAPDAALTSATNDWSVYYTYAIGQALKGEKIATNWAKGYSDGAVGITALGTACAAGTAEKVAEVEAALKNGTLKVFDLNTFTAQAADGVKVDANGKVTEYLADIDGDFTGETNVVKDGYIDESNADEFRSAPYFALRIDGIVEHMKSES